MTPPPLPRYNLVMDRTWLKIGVGFLVGLAAAYILFSPSERERAEEEARPEAGEPKKRKIIPFPLWRLERRRLP